MAKSKAVKIVTVIGILMTGLETATWFVPFRIIEENLYPSTAFARHTPPYPEIGIEEAYTPARSNIEAALQLPAFWNFEYKKTVIKSSHLTSIKASAIIVSPEPQTVIVKRWFLPGWSAMIDNVPVPINLDPKTGLIWMLLPPGEHLLEVGYTGSKIEELGNRLALVGVIVWMTITVQDRRVGRLRRHDEDKSLRGRK